MNNVNIIDLKEKIIRRAELYKIGNSRIKRLVKDPFRTLIFYTLVFISYIKPFKIKSKTLWGDKISYYLPEGNMVYYYGFYEINLINFLINFIKPGMVIIDIGANIGLYSLLSAWLTEENGFVYSFEPTPRTFITLQENAKQYRNIITIEKALLDDEREITFFDYGPKYSFLNTINNRISKHLSFLKKYTKPINLKTEVFDNLLRKKQIKIPDLIKIDVEGSEFHVLNGMKETIIRHRPYVTIEVGGGEEWRENNINSINFLLNNNYAAFEIESTGKIREHSVRDSYTYDNLLFIPIEKINSRKDLLI